MKSLLNGRVTLHAGDCLTILPTLAENSVDSVVCDPPYHLTTGKNGGTGIASLNENSPAGRSRIGTGFMGKQWDGGDVAFRPETWAAVLRVLKPGGLALAGPDERARESIKARLVGKPVDAGPLFGALAMSRPAP